MLRNIFLLVLTFFITSCSSDANEAFLGHYQYKSKFNGKVKFIEIKKENDICIYTTDGKNGIVTQEKGVYLKVINKSFTLYEENNVHSGDVEAIRVHIAAKEKIKNNQKVAKQICTAFD